MSYKFYYYKFLQLHYKYLIGFELVIFIILFNFVL